MASTYSTNLGIELIGSGEQSGTWGTTTNNNLGTLLEQAISGVTTTACTGGTDTITIPNGASGTARNMFLELTGTGGGSLVVPANKKLYFIYNNTSLAITVKVTGQTGVSVPAAAKTILVMNSAGTDVVNATNYFSALTLGAALPVASGGTGLATLTANNVILGNGTSSPTFVAPTTSGNILTANGTTWVSSAPATNGTVTSVAMSVPTFLSVAGSPVTTSGTLAVTLSGTALPVANGGTGVTSTTAYAVYTGNSAGTGFTAIANGTTGQILTATTSGAPSWSSSFTGNVTGNVTGNASGTAANVTGTVAVANGGTGATTATAYAVQCGGTTSTGAHQSVISVGTSGQVLTSNGAGALPTFQTLTSFVSGMIMLWSGSAASIPSGWLLCNGASSTPDLRDRFVVGAGSTYAVNATGGTADAVVVSHNHTLTDPGHFHTAATTSGFGTSGSFGSLAASGSTSSATTGVTVDTAGVSGTNANLPPYYALCYIMKT